MAQQAVRITIPDDLDYADLKLSRDVVTGGVDFDWAPIAELSGPQRPARKDEE